MDAGIRQRLVGAAVLIALAVIFLPLLFDFHENAGNGGIDRTQPEPPDAAEYEDLPVDPRSAPTTLLPAPDPDAPEPASLDPALPVADPALDTAAPVDDVPAPVVLDPPEPAPPPPAPPPVEPLPVPVPPPPPSTSAGRYSVVYGSFRSRANADEVKAQLALNLGIETRIEAINSGDRQLFRVRSDRHASRADAEAERLRALAQIANLSASVVGNALPAADAPQRPTTDTNPAAHAVQIGVFGSSGAAQQLADQLRSQRFNAYVETIRLAAGTRYRVRVGPYTQRSDADRAREQLRNRYRDAQVVAHP
jgi:DedD protein